MKSKVLQWFAIVLIIETGLLHFFTAQGAYEEAAYLGYLFMANFLGALVAAYGIYRKQVWGWALGFVIAAGSMIAYIWSRTLGMPGMAAEEWFTPFGLVAMAVEGLFILLVLVRPWRMVVARDEQPSTPARLSYLLPISGLLVVALISVSAYRWDMTAIQVEHGHISSVTELRTTPLTSFDELEERYGVRVSLVALTAMDSIVDVRFKILDPEKAHSLFDHHAALLVDQQLLILAPHMHGHGRLKPGVNYVIFFPNPQQAVHTGTPVSVVFGNLRIESISAQ